MNKDTPRWLIMPTTAMEAKINQFEADMGLPDGYTEKIFKRHYKDNLMTISIVGGFRGMRGAAKQNDKGRKFNDEDVSNIMKDLGFAAGKPLKTDAEMVAAGKPLKTDAEMIALGWQDIN